MRTYVEYLAVVSLIFLVGEAVGGAASVDKSQVVEGMGVIIQNNQAAARVRAIRDALRKALEQVVADLLTPSALVENLQSLDKHLYTQALKYIRSYRVVWEYPDTSLKAYRVGIETEVAIDAVTRVIQTLGLSQRGGGKGRFLVFVVERHLEGEPLRTFGSDDGVVAPILRTHLQEQGLHVMHLETGTAWNGQKPSAVMIGKQAGAAVVLIGQAGVQKVHNEVAGMSLQAVKATVQVDTIATATGERLALEQAEATAFHTDAILGELQALKKAATEVATRLVPSLRTYQQAQEGGKTLQNVQ